MKIRLNFDNEKKGNVHFLPSAFVGVYVWMVDRIALKSKCFQTPVESKEKQRQRKKEMS